LHDAILDRRYAQRALLAVGFRNVHATHRLRLVRLLLEFFRQFLQPLRHSVCFDGRKRLPIDARRSLIHQTALPGSPQYVLAIHLVVQGVEAVLGFSLRFGMQRHL